MSAPSRPGAGGGGGSSTSASHTAIVAALAAVGLGVGGLSLAYLWGRGGGGGGNAGGGGAGAGVGRGSGGAAGGGVTPGGEDSSTVSSSRSVVSLTAEQEAQQKLLDKLDRTIASLQSGAIDEGYLTIDEGYLTPPNPAAAGGGSSRLARSSAGASVASYSTTGRSLTSGVQRTLRDIRAKRWKKQHGLRLTVTHRLRMVQLILLYWRCNDQQQASSGSAGGGAGAAAAGAAGAHAETEQQRRSDFELCWQLLHSHVHEADPNPAPLSPAAAASAAAAGSAAAAAVSPGSSAAVPALSSPSSSSLVHPFAYAPFPAASERNDVLRHLLEVALDLRDPARMWSALKELLRIGGSGGGEGSAAAAPAASAAAASSSAVSSSSSSEPIVLPPSLLLSLDHTSVFVALHVAALLGCWLLTYQLAHRLFGAARAAEQLQRQQQQLRLHPSSPEHGGDEVAESDTLYDALHQRALEAPVGAAPVDLAVVSEIATLRLLAALAHQPGSGLLERLHMRREQVAPSVLPFSESGRVIDSPTVSPTGASAAASSAAHASAGISSPSASSEEALSPRSPRSIGESAAAAVTEGSTNGNGGAPWPCAWQSWQILAYSTVLRSLVWPKASHERCGVLRELEQQQLSTPVHHHVYNASTIPGVPPAVAAVVGNLPDEQGMLPLPARRILRQGRLFSMTGLFHQPIPVVGTLISEPAAAPGAAAQVQGTMPGSTFSMQGYAHVADANAAESGGGFTQFEYYKLSVAGNNGNGGSTGSGSGSITASMVAAAQAQAGEASPPAQPGSAASSASSAAAVPSVSPLTVQLDGLSAPRTPPRSGGRPGSEGGLGGEFGFGPESPPSAHLFASASFATLSGSGLLEQHFTPSSSSAAAAASAPAAGAQQDAILPSLEHQPPVVRHLSSASSTSSTSSSSSSMTPEPFLALERHQASLPPSVAAATETWTGLYRVIQAPSAVAADADTTVVRPRVEVYYELRLLVAREHNNGAALSPSAAGGGAAGASH